MVLPLQTDGRSLHNADGSYTFRGTVGDFGGGKVALDQPGISYRWWLNVNSPFVEKANWRSFARVNTQLFIRRRGVSSSAQN